VTALSKKVFTELQVYLWRIRFDNEDEWRPEIYLMGSDSALRTMHDALISMSHEFQTEGQSTRKFLCNPPEDVDVVRLAREKNAEIEWQIWLIFRLEKESKDVRVSELKNKAVTVRLHEYTLNQFLQILDNQLSNPDEYPQGQHAPGGLYLATNWFKN
jgi:hypothetical protein